MAFKWKVRMVTTGGMNKTIEVIANTQQEAHKTAEAQNPGYKAAGSMQGEHVK